MSALIAHFCPTPPPLSPPPAAPIVAIPALLHWMALYIGTSICLVALVITRQAYKLSPGFRARLAKTGFHQLAADAPAIEKAAVMSSVLNEAWPATVSEMLQDTEAAHGMIFRSLMVAGCLSALQADFSALTPAAPSGSVVSTALDVVHLLRKLSLCAAVGFCFAPATGHDHSVASLRQQTSLAAEGAESRSARLAGVPWLEEAHVKALPADVRAEMARTTIVGTVHTLLATSMLSLLPLLELLALAGDAWSAAEERSLAFDARSVAWCAVALSRLLPVGAINVCTSVFAFHFVGGFFSREAHHGFKGFWAEYVACRLFAQLMLLAAVQSWFAWPAAFDAAPQPLRAAALLAAAAHLVSCGLFCARNALLCMRNVEYDQDELAGLFALWRAQESAVQTLLDAQLALYERVQTQLLRNERPRSGGGGTGWLLLRQLHLLRRLQVASTDALPVPASPRASPMKKKA